MKGAYNGQNWFIHSIRKKIIAESDYTVDDEIYLINQIYGINW
ncbi:hypothetical protein [Leuconostoc gelidum]|nr:hypothetical protein [Leuconostoc gelidum]